MINVTLGENPKKEKPFPKLMITNDGKNRIVFFVREKEGISLDSGKSCTDTTIHFSVNWAMEYFTDYNDPITIQNA